MLKNVSSLTILILFLLHTWLAAAANQKLLEDIQFEAPSADEERIIFKLNGTYIPKIFALKGEKPRVVFDFPGIKTSKLLNNIINTNGKFIKRIRIGIHREPHPKTRVVFDLIQDKDIDFTQKFDTRKKDLIITVHYAGTEPSPPPVTLKKEKKPEPSVQEPAVQTMPSPELPKEVTVPVAQDETTAKKEKKSVKPSEPPVEQQTETPEPEQAPLTKPAKQEQPVPVRTPRKTSSGSAPLLSAISFDNSSNRGEMVLFKLNEFHPPIVFGLEEGLPRVVCDFKETAIADNLTGSITTGGKYIQTIRIGKEKSPQKVRVVLDLVPSNSYDLQQVFFKNENLFVIIVNILHNAPSAQEQEKPLE